MASGTRGKTAGNPTSSRPVFSDAHKGRPCAECILCKEKCATYTHPVKWKNEALLPFLRTIEPSVNIQPEACICLNCRVNLGTGQKNAENYHPRWVQQSTHIADICKVPECDQPATRTTKLGTSEDISRILKCSSINSDSAETKLCNSHYRALHRQLKPHNYQWKCAVCLTATRSYLTCSEPDTFQKNLEKQTNFVGKLTANDKVCMACYRYSLTVAKLSKENPISNDEDFFSLLQGIQNTVPVLPLCISKERELIDIALKYTVIGVAQMLHSNRALTLLDAHSMFVSNVRSFLPLSTLDTAPERLRTRRWVLGQLSTHLKHHLSYTCTVKKHGIAFNHYKFVPMFADILTVHIADDLK